MSESRALVAHRAAAKRSLIQFSSLLILTTLITGLSGLFAVWSLNRTHDRTEAQLVQIVGTIERGRAAQVQFKVQVQEWKNFLLRGESLADRDTYLRAFLDSEAKTQAILADLSHRPDPVLNFHLAQSVNALIDEHKTLSQHYAGARSLMNEQHWNYAVMDRAVRGLDRPVNQHVDEFVEHVNAQLQGVLGDAIAYERHRYDQLARVIWLAMLLTIVLVGTLIWRLFTGRVKVG